MPMPGPVPVPAEDAMSPDRGEAETFATLYRSNVDAIKAYCYRRLARSDVDDAVSEVFAVAWRKIDDVPRDGSERFWLYGVARNTIRNLERSRRRRMRLRDRLGSLGAAHHPELPDVQVVRADTIERVLEALSTLRPMDQEVLRLRTWEELDRHEIALVFGISPEAADMRVNRAVKRMAKALRSSGVASAFVDTAPDQEGTHI